MKQIFIDCCKDKTLTWRYRNKRPFNGVAIPVFSVDTEIEAEMLILSLGRKQYIDHPLLPGKPWYKCTLDGELDFKPYLEIEDLPAVTKKIEERYLRLRERMKI